MSRHKRRGRILAIKWGLNPNSSSLGVDVTFLLLGAAAVSIATPFIAALVRFRRPLVIATPAAGTDIPGDSSDSRENKSGGNAAPRGDS